MRTFVAEDSEVLVLLEGRSLFTAYGFELDVDLGKEGGDSRSRLEE